MSLKKQLRDVCEASLKQLKVNEENAQKEKEKRQKEMEDKENDRMNYCIEKAKSWKREEHNKSNLKQKILAHEKLHAHVRGKRKMGFATPTPESTAIAINELAHENSDFEGLTATPMNGYKEHRDSDNPYHLAPGEIKPTNRYCYVEWDDPLDNH